MGITFKTNVSNHRPVKDVINKVVELQTQNTAIVLIEKDFNTNFPYYYNRKIFENVDPKKGIAHLDDQLQKINVFSPNQFNLLPNSAIQKFDQILFVDSGGSFSKAQNIIRDKVKNYFVSDEKHEFVGSLDVHVYKGKGLPW